MMPTASNRFGQLIREMRERRDLTQDNIARELHIDRTMVARWERGQLKQAVAPQHVNALARVLSLSVLDLVLALGYDVRFEGIEDEEEVAILSAYRQLSLLEQRLIRAALALPGQRQTLQALESLRRLGDTGRPAGQGTQ